MARKELLLAGFRNVKMVAGMVKQRKAAQLLAATSKLPTGTTAQKAPAAAPATPANPAQQLKEAGVQRTAPAAPSFAASSAAAPAAAPRGLFGGLARRVAEAQARAAPEPRPLESPSFAATPGWPKFRKKLTDRDDAQMAAIAQQLTAAEARRRIPPGAPRNPLFWWAKLGEPAVPAAAKKAAAEQPAGKQLRQALKSYAELAPSAAPKPAAPKLRPMAAWHKYAMMK